MVDLGVSLTDCLPGVERCIEGMSVLVRGVSMSMRDVLCLSVVAQETCGCPDLLGTAAASDRFDCGFC
jgi:hypothetical protein